uniref:Uncharacterized protein n=1 Tax=Parascaris univalens TaxID=6257 RepID=A0A914ZFR0_PARUN
MLRASFSPLIILIASTMRAMGSILGGEIHCTRMSAIQGDVYAMDDSGRTVDTKSSSVAELTLKETLCLNFTESSSSQLHAIEFVRMEQHFPVLAAYKFAIPQMSSSCICDCAGAEQYCSVETHRYKNCTKGSVCYRTYHSHQSNSGCLTSARSEVCCEISIEPYNGKIFTAIKLNQPDTVVVLKHRIYERIASRWIEATSDEFDAVVNKGSARIESVDRRKIEIRVTSGRVIREMSDGMYYYSDDDRTLMMGVRLNEPTESDVHKLGWMRKENGTWNVRNGIVKITDSQHVTVESCKGQKYLTRYNAEYFVSGTEGWEDLDLGYRVDDQSWVEAVSVAPDGRSVRVVHAEGTAVHLTINSDIRPLVVHHSSQVNSFSGSIQMDEKSNRYLNLTITGGKGTLIGYVHRSEEKVATEWSFSVEVGNILRSSFTTTVGGIPLEITSDRYVCLHPAGDTNAELCKWFRYEATPLRERHIAHRWQTNIGDCPGCNERGFDNFLQKLDPREWLDGLNSTTEVVTCALEVALVIAGLLATILIFTKCIIPLAR